MSAASASLARSAESWASRTAAECFDQPIDLLGVAAVLGPERLDLRDPALVLGDDPLAALVRDAEQRALQALLDALQPFGPVLDASRVIGSRRESGVRPGLLRRAFEEGDPRLGLTPHARQLVDLALQRADLRGVDEGREAERRRLAQLVDPTLQLRDRGLRQVQLIAKRAEALLLGRIEQTLPGDPGLAGDVGEPAREVGEHRRRLQRRPGQVGRDHLRQGVELGPGPLGVPHQVLVQHDAEVTSALAHLLQSTTAVAQQVDQRHALGIEQLEGEAYALGRVLDPGEGIGDVREHVLAATQVAILVAERDAQLSQGILGLARPLCRLGGTAHEALERHVERLLLDPGRLGREAQLLQRLDPDSDLVGGLADRIGSRDRAVHERGEAADRGHAGERATEGADTGAQQLRLAAQILEPARGLAACGLDALQALLAALADRDQLSLDLAAALDRQADRISLSASGHGSVFVMEIRCLRASPSWPVSRSGCSDRRQP